MNGNNSQQAKIEVLPGAKPGKYIPYYVVFVYTWLTEKGLPSQKDRIFDDRILDVDHEIRVPSDVANIVEVLKRSIQEDHGTKNPPDELHIINWKKLEEDSFIIEARNEMK